MKKPITVTVEREHGNSGDVIMTIRGADSEERKVACPGDCSPYTALTGIRGQLAEVLNEGVTVDDIQAAKEAAIVANDTEGKATDAETVST